MKYFWCPNTYRRKQYGCGFGPVNATQAFLDLNSTCPTCGKALKPHTKTKAQAEHRQAEHETAVDMIRGMFGEQAAADYAQTHKVKR